MDRYLLIVTDGPDDSLKVEKIMPKLAKLFTSIIELNYHALTEGIKHEHGSPDFIAWLLEKDGDYPASYTEYMLKIGRVIPNCVNVVVSPSWITRHDMLEAGCKTYCNFIDQLPFFFKQYFDQSQK